MNIAVYCASAPGNRAEYRDGAAALGRWIGSHGHMLVYGGSNTGLMGIVADAALAAGGTVTGVVPDVPVIKARQHPGLTRYIYTQTMAERRSAMLELADACIALPGGPGTLDEIGEALSLSRLGILAAPCVLFDIAGFYQPLRQLLDEMRQTAFVEAGDLDRVLFSADLDEVGRFLQAERRK